MLAFHGPVSCILDYGADPNIRNENGHRSAVVLAPILVVLIPVLF